MEAEIAVLQLNDGNLEILNPEQHLVFVVQRFEFAYYSVLIIFISPINLLYKLSCISRAVIILKHQNRLFKIS
jgi:hypothetical protein